ncbi:Vibriobactin utilization protein ViuB [Corynebacterium endometrii]|uniref:Vibriobactin utilization protein ViuB n=2 Tax=Corynebacterium endometrii TaxID=2488819 RepID=A0A4P7QH14_9CORY|nr:Vibriobactin utilization protein ViuB [Corynebacterium endometrii]
MPMNPEAQSQSKPRHGRGMPGGPRKGFTAREAVVVTTRRLSPSMVRVTFRCEELQGVELAFTDHYIKLLFVPDGADYQWPFKPGEIRESKPREMWPITRTYTIRSFDQLTGLMDVDFVLHGDEGLAGAWAAKAREGDVIGFGGPGGAWKPQPHYDRFVLAGDESAAPAIAAAVEALPAEAPASIFIEVEDAAHRFEMPREVTWIYREGATAGTELARAVRNHGVPSGRTSWFVHGVAEMVKDVRRFLFAENGVDRKDASISGYWRLGMTESQWQSSKREFVAEMEAQEAAAVQGRG